MPQITLPQWISIFCCCYCSLSFNYCYVCLFINFNVFNNAIRILLKWKMVLFDLKKTEIQFFALITVYNASEMVFVINMRFIFWKNDNDIKTRCTKKTVWKTSILSWYSFRHHEYVRVYIFIEQMMRDKQHAFLFI